MRRVRRKTVSKTSKISYPIIKFIPFHFLIQRRLIYSPICLINNIRQQLSPYVANAKVTSLNKAFSLRHTRSIYTYSFAYTEVESSLTGSIEIVVGSGDRVARANPLHSKHIPQKRFDKLLSKFNCSIICIYVFQIGIYE